MAKASPFGTTTLVSTMSQNGPEAFIIDGKNSNPLSVMAFTPKCAFATSISLICGVPQASIPTREFPDQWLMGVLKTNDSLFLIDTATDSAREIVNPEKILGRKLDMTDMHAMGNSALFTNKLDSSLWTVSF